MSLSPADFIRRNLSVVDGVALEGASGVRLYQGHPASGLRRLVGDDGPAPYWAYPWAGGAALVQHMLERSQIVAGRRVLDLGAGSGVVGILAARLGAAEVIAAEIDPYAAVAIGLNAALNNVELTLETRDLLAGDPPPVDLVLVGDLYYAPDLARRVTAFLRRCLASGVEVLIGDPGREDLPLDDLEEIGRYAAVDFGASAADEGWGRVFRLKPSSGPDS